MSIKMLSVIVLIIYFNYAVVEAGKPTFKTDFSTWKFPEDTPVGSSVFEVLAVDEIDNTNVKYAIENAEMFSINENTGVLTLTRSVDYDNNLREVVIKIRAFDANGVEALVDVSIDILDANDNPAQFTKTDYKVKADEDTPVGTVLFDKLRVTDIDVTNIFSGITVTCDNTNLDVLYQDSCKVFSVKPTRRSNRAWEGQLILEQPLDFEGRPTYQVQLRTWDGKNPDFQSFEIEVVDINDAKPYFTRKVESTVNETQQNMTLVNFVKAVDGDRNNPREIRYTLVCNGSTYFHIDYITGEIFNIRPLDREEAGLSAGYVDLCVRASEVIQTNPEVIGTTNLTTVDAVVRINIQDQNDNEPKFDNSVYNVTIYESIANETPLPELIMTVVDPDLGTANLYRFELLDYTDRFAIFPDSGRAQTTASIKVIDTSKIDYESGQILYILRVRAIETDTVNPNTGNALVYVNVLDDNDNVPVFNPPNYSANISEQSPAGLDVVRVFATDDDTNQDIRFRLVGNGADKFTIDPISGQIKVAFCNTPGVNPCIDYEQRRQYQLTVMAIDDGGNGRQSTGRLTVDIYDVNDNPPVFRQPSYIRYINEGEINTIDPLIIETDDLDTVGNPTVYRLTNNETWTIDPISGRIQARQPITYEDSNNGSYYLEVIAQNVGEPFFPQTVSVRIFVIDKNNYPPYFVPVQVDRTYTEEISENTLPNVFVIDLDAEDNDSPTTENGQIEYSIKTGSQGKFVIDRKNGSIYTSDVATFDYDVQSNYTLLVYAQDGGVPQKTGTATVRIIIIDANNRNPFFVPTTQRFEISENVVPGTIVGRATAKDPDRGNQLRYRFEGPKSATVEGAAVDIANYDYTQAFEMDPDGTIRTTTYPLDRDRASSITYQMIVRDTSSTAVQEGTGTVIITILEYNDEAPYFAADEFNITIDEELPSGTFIVTLLALDKDDIVNTYLLTSNPGNYFAVSPQTGVISMNERLDYEKIRYTEFVLIAIDNGQNRLTGTTTVKVNVRNINDNSPQFAKDIYLTRVNEQRAPANQTSEVLMTVSADDIDIGDFGDVEYRLNPEEKRFVIDKLSGEIRLAPGAELDRETEPTVVVQVTAYDSPKTHSPTNFVRREFTIPVYFELIDVNDNPPVFNPKRYEQVIIETTLVDTVILTLQATDADIDQNLVFRKTRSEPGDLFAVGLLSGDIIVGKSLLNRDGVYDFEVDVIDDNGFGSSDRAFVTITVLEATNSPPRIIKPPSENMTIEVLESQYLGMLVYDVYAVDDDTGPSGMVEYGFYHEGIYTNHTGEFHINSVTGVIHADIVYDREQVDRYLLQLVARDGGDPFLETTRFINVQILDVNDNKPVFPMENGVVKPYNFNVRDNSPIGTFVGIVSARDRDLEEYSRIYYVIIAGNENNLFRINPNTGNITLNKPLDRETLNADVISLYVHATNNVSDYSVIREKREVDPSIVEVRVSIDDVNDQAPMFVFPAGVDEYHGCISLDALYGQSVVQVQASDEDLEGPANIRYNITGGNTNTMFTVHPSNGIISNILFPNQYNERVYVVRVTASDSLLSTSTNVPIFVVSSSNEVTLKISQQPAEVRRMTPQLIRTFTNIGNVDYVCVTGIRESVLADGTLSTTSTDVKVTGIRKDGNGFIVYDADDLYNTLVTAKSANENDFNALYITNLQPTSEGSLFSLDRTPVLAVFIIVLLLILMAIILIILACCCIRDSKRKQIKKYNAEQGTVVHVAEQPVDVGKSVNPVYDNRAFVANEQQSAPVPVPVIVPDLDDDRPDPAVFQSQSAPEPDPEIESQYASVNKPSTSEPVIITTIEEDENIPEPQEAAVFPEPITEDLEPPEPIIEPIVEDVPSDSYPPPPVTEDEIETEIKDDSNPPSPDQPRRTTPPIKEEDEPKTSF